MPCDCILKVKRDGIYKIRAIIKGFRMAKGLDYNETFAPVPCMAVIRFFLALAAHLDWEIKQGDVHTAFLCADMDTDVWVSVPNWFKVGASGKETGYTIRKLLKGVPGIPQGPRLFHKKSHAIYTSLGLQQCKSEHCLYFCQKRKIYLLVWVDDLFLFFPPEAITEAKTLWTNLQANLQLDDWQDIDDCLACYIKRDRANRTLTISQEPAVRKWLERIEWQDANDKNTPMAAGAKLSKKDCPSTAQAAVMHGEQVWYRSNIAAIVWFMRCTRPDITYATIQHCRFMHNPGEVHISSLKRLIRYIKSTADYGLKFDFSQATRGAKISIHGFYDAAHADCPDTLKSTLAHIMLYGSCPISWWSKLNTILTLSTNHSEYCAAAHAAREAKRWDTLLGEIGMTQLARPIDLFSDSKGCIAMTYNPVQRSASKHVDLADHYAREQQELGVITITYVPTRDMLADVLTKALPPNDFLRHAPKLVSKLQM